MKLPPTNFLLNITITKIVIIKWVNQVPERTWDARRSVQLLGKECQDLGGHDGHDRDHDSDYDDFDYNDDEYDLDDDDLPALTMAWLRKKDAAAPAAANRA